MLPATRPPAHGHSLRPTGTLWLPDDAATIPEAWPAEPLESRQPQVTTALWGRPYQAGWPIYSPLALLAVITALFHWTNLDLWISAWFYDPVSQQWSWFFSPWCTLFYRAGTYPAVGVAVWGGVLLLQGIFHPNRRDSLKSGLFLLMVFGLGPGLTVNYVFKQHWGRPRPHQVTAFNGPHKFIPIAEPGTLRGHNSSFPSGHAAVAFYLIAPAFLVHGRRPRLANILLFAGLTFGLGMSAARVVQGGHFATDVIWSAGILYITCVVIAHLVLQPRMLPAMAHELELRQRQA